MPPLSSVQLLPLLVLVLVAAVSAADGEAEEEAADVATLHGTVRGRRFGHFYKFLGVPYATPPVKSLRFLPPQAARPWEGVLACHTIGPACPQVVGGRYLGEEDCLYLNIFTPSLPAATVATSILKPVLVWIHGGSFVLGSGDERVTSPATFMGEEVVVVSLNYRLGPLGFLSFDNEVVPGNMGLWDQREALLWVRNNIHYFGGDPGRVTLFGEDAGGVSVHAHVLSPRVRAEALVAGAICQSGTLLYKNIQEGGEAGVGESVARLFNCSSGSLDFATLDCLQEVDLEELVTRTQSDRIKHATLSRDELLSLPSYDWGPVVDSHSSRPFLPQSPLELLKSGSFPDIPFMSGTVADEGATTVIPMYNHLDKVLDNWDIVGPHSLRLVTTPWRNSTDKTEVSREEQRLANIVRKVYTGDSFTMEDKQGLMQMFGDSRYLSPDQKTVSLMAEKSKQVYNYQFTYRGSFSLSLLYGAPENLASEDFGVVHGDDLLYLFKSVLPDLAAGEEKEVGRRMVEMWANFAKYGSPTPFWEEGREKWTPVDTTLGNYMELDSEPRMKTQLEKRRMMFWERVLWSKLENDIERDVLVRQTAKYLLPYLYKP